MIMTVHFIDENIDTGDIISQTRTFYSDSDTLRTAYNRLRILMVSLFDACWPDVRECKIIGVRQNRSEGTLHYKNDFDGIYESLPNGWDTIVSDIQINSSGCKHSLR